MLAYDTSVLHDHLLMSATLSGALRDTEVDRIKFLLSRTSVGQVNERFQHRQRTLCAEAQINTGAKRMGIVRGFWEVVTRVEHLCPCTGLTKRLRATPNKTLNPSGMQAMGKVLGVTSPLHILSHIYTSTKERKGHEYSQLEL